MEVANTYLTVIKNNFIREIMPNTINQKYASSGYKKKTLSIEEYLDKIRLYLSNMINNHKTKDS